MIDWLLASIDPARVHNVGTALSWHARLMTLGWGVLIPLGIFAARSTKVLPWHKWPEEIDNRFCWTAHRGLQYGGIMLAIVGVGLIVQSGAAPHRLFGRTVMGLGLTQIAHGWLRGSKGGRRIGSCAATIPT